MTNTIDIEPDPLSLRRLLGLMCLSIALILTISTLTNRRIELKKPDLAISLRSMETKVEASSIQEVIPAIALETPQEVAQAPEPVVVVETPPPVVQEPVKPVITPEPVKPKPKPKVVDQVGAKAFIYHKESGNHPCKINGGAVDCEYQGSKACGIGQALPCSKLRNECNLADYACQDRWFTRYMENRYGSWENAKAFWLKNKWW